MQKKCSLELKAFSNSLGLPTSYEVVRVVNSIEWTPGESLTEEQVKKLLGRPTLNITFVKGR